MRKIFTTYFGLKTKNCATIVGRTDVVTVDESWRSIVGQAISVKLNVVLLISTTLLNENIPNLMHHA
jgi:uncharacterized protein with GYD domain